MIFFFYCFPLPHLHLEFGSSFLVSVKPEVLLLGFTMFANNFNRLKLLKKIYNEMNDILTIENNNTSFMISDPRGDKGLNALLTGDSY